MTGLWRMFTAAIDMDPKDAVAYNDRAIAYRKQTNGNVR